MKEKFGLWYRGKVVEELAEKFAKSSFLFVTEFTKLKVNDLEQLRKNLNKNSATFMVVKNSLARLALRKTNKEILDKLLDGQVGFILGGNDPIVISKVLIDYSKNYTDFFKIKGGILEAQFLSQDKIKELSQLPSKSVLVGKFLGNLKSFLARFVNSINLNVKLLQILKAIEEKKKEG